MSAVRFYHLSRSSLEQALPSLLEKCLARDWRVVVRLSSRQRVEMLNQNLWVAAERSFLPHGCFEDGEAERQPIWLTAEDERPNGATVLMLCEGCVSEKMAEYALVCDVFSGDDAEALAAARQRWRHYQATGHDLTYWQQMEKGWEQKEISQR